MRNGNESSAWKFLTCSSRFLPYLWGMETVQSQRFRCSHNNCSYRTYEEWKLFLFGKMKRVKLCSYRTYEEWKQLFKLLESEVRVVLTVPMRNGNTLSSHLKTFPTSTFLPYLWGMETPNWIRLQSRDNLTVLTVPMRNGNAALRALIISVLNCSYRTYEEWKHSHTLRILNGIQHVLTVPMRNGNWRGLKIILMIISSYRTYEEWKLTKPIYIRYTKTPRSYRTYEEWKLKLFPASNACESSSYRTYEEWKRYKQWPKQRPWSVLTVPMRNGNAVSHSWIKYWEKRFLPYLWGMETPKTCHRSTGTQHVLTVPMRNGNCVNLLQLCLQLLVLTVPMRNGNFHR